VGKSHPHPAKVETLVGNGTPTDLYIGGLVGRNQNASVNGAIRNCYALSDVSGDRYVGCLVGTNGSACSVSDCYAAGVVTGLSTYGGRTFRRPNRNRRRHHFHN
jgi:hypothetical protein